MTALARKYGPKSFAVVQVDAHHDLYLYDFGRTVHNGQFMKKAVEFGIISGRDLVQVDLRGQRPDAKVLEWMKQNQLRFHTMTEVNTRGWNATLARILEEVKGKKVYISFDMDGVDPSSAPGVSTSDPDGLTAAQVLQLVRALGIQNEVVAADFLEWNVWLSTRTWQPPLSNRLDSSPI